jgi:hypothetical protein
VNRLAKKDCKETLSGRKQTERSVSIYPEDSEAGKIIEYGQLYL